jgi:hypothetical protein
MHYCLKIKLFSFSPFIDPESLRGMPLSCSRKKEAQRNARLRRADGRTRDTVLDGYRKPSLYSALRAGFDLSILVIFQNPLREILLLSEYQIIYNLNP